jgi:MFS transporter, DHA1 family, tetracycline resistance protein
MAEQKLPKLTTRVRFPSPAPDFLFPWPLGNALAALPSTVRFILATIVIDAIGFGVTLPVTPQLVMDVGGMDVSGAAKFGGMLALLYAGFQFIFGPIIGNLGDRFGRRPILLGSLAGYAINFALMGVAPSLGWLLVGQALAGIFGGSYGAAQAALADVTDPKDRARVFGFVGAAFGVGFTFGPVLGGLLGEIGPRIPFFAASALGALNFVYGLTIFPETLKPEHRRAFDWKRANPLGALSGLGRMPGMALLGVLLVIWQVASLVYPLTWGYYLIAAYGATPRQIGLTLAFVGVSMTAVQMLLTGRIVARFGERGAAMIGLGGAATAFLGFAIAPHWHWAALSLLVMPLQSIVQPCLSALVSQRGSANNQGEVQGFAAAMMALGSLIGPVTLNPALAWFTSPSAPFQMPGAAFLLSFALALFALVLIALARARD